MLLLGSVLAFAAVAVVLIAVGDFVLERNEIFKSLRSVRQIEPMTLLR